MSHKRFKELNTTHCRKTIFFPGEDNTDLVLSKVTYKQKYAWDTLFADMSTDEIIEYINSTWIDPRYMLVKVESNHLPFVETHGERQSSNE